jgi:hypothetical protein
MHNPSLMVAQWFRTKKLLANQLRNLHETGGASTVAIPHGAGKQEKIAVCVGIAAKLSFPSPAGGCLASGSPA